MPNANICHGVHGPCPMNMLESIMIRHPTRKPASPPKEIPLKITIAATGLKLGTIKNAALPATPIAARTAITMISRAFGFLPSNIIKKGSIAATITIRLQTRYFRPWKTLTDRYRSNGTTRSITPSANHVRLLTLPSFVICRMISPSVGSLYSSGSSGCSSFVSAACSGCRSSQNSSINVSNCCSVSM